MRLKFNQPYADSDAGYKSGQEYDFIDTRKASYFIDRGIAVPVELAKPAAIESHKVKPAAAGAQPRTP